jgi:hypothetical protein
MTSPRWRASTGFASASLVVSFRPLVLHAMGGMVARNASRGLTAVAVGTLPTQLGVDADDPFLSLRRCATLHIDWHASPALEPDGDRG